MIRSTLSTLQNTTMGFISVRVNLLDTGLSLRRTAMEKIHDGRSIQVRWGRNVQSLNNAEKSDQVMRAPRR